MPENTEQTTNGVNSIDLSIEPTAILDKNDPGDDTLRRFRYQVTYAGILCARMIEEDDVSEIYCEHHEDILLKYEDGTFRGVQVKTKDINLPPFNIEDEAITKSLQKFVTINHQFPDKFQGFTILSNHGFDKTSPARCLNTLIETVKNEGIKILDKNTKFKNLITKLASDCKCSLECVIETLQKVKPLTFCNLEDVHMKLINQIKSCELLKGITESKLNDIADLVVARCFKASSLFVDNDKLIHSYVMGTHDASEEQLTIEAKRIEKKEFTEWISKQKTTPATILLKDRVSISPTDGHRLLTIKMDAGGIDSDNISLAKDFKYSFEQHAISWVYKDNSTDSIDKYNQVLKVTQNLCKEIYDEEDIANKTGAGQSMLIRVRKKIKERMEANPSIFFDCSYEHVLGVVGVLTENCKIWWSNKFDTSSE